MKRAMLEGLDHMHFVLRTHGIVQLDAVRQVNQRVWDSVGRACWELSRYVHAELPRER